LDDYQNGQREERKAAAARKEGLRWEILKRRAARRRIVPLETPKSALRSEVGRQENEDF